MDRLVAIWPALVLIALVAGILALNNQSALDPMFRWLPVPLWCYALPMLLTSVGWLPAQHAVYGWITDRLFPVVLGILLFGVDLRGLSRTGWRAGLAMAVGTGSIGVMGADTGNVSLSGTAVGTFADKNMGTGKTVTISGLAITGSSIGNYSLTQPATTANITPSDVALSGVASSVR